jgi:hypothetical protein
MAAPILSIPSPKVELGALLLIAWLAFASVPAVLGGIGLGWDALNHHVYLGWIAGEHRFDRDFLAASNQSFQYPYLYWPLYKLVASGSSGTTAGVVLVSMNLLAVPPLWLLARAGVPEASWYGLAMRWLGVALAFLTGVVLSLFDSTSNDLLAAIPLVWAIALGMQPMVQGHPDSKGPRTLVLLSGLCAGASVAFKLSNGPLAILLPFLWGFHGRSVRQRLGSMALGSAGALAGFLLLYGWWGWQMWVHYGNPIYPFHDHWFEPLRALRGGQ